MHILQSKRPGVGVDGLDRPLVGLPRPWRVRLVIATLALGAVGLLGRAVYLNLNQGEFLRNEGTHGTSARWTRTRRVA